MRYFLILICAVFMYGCSDETDELLAKNDLAGTWEVTASGSTTQEKITQVITVADQSITVNGSQYTGNFSGADFEGSLTRTIPDATITEDVKYQLKSRNSFNLFIRTTVTRGTGSTVVSENAYGKRK